MNRFAPLLLGLLALAGPNHAATYHGVAVAPNSNHAWVVRYSGPAVLHSSDLGSTWVMQRTFTNNRNPIDVFSLDSLSGWLCGKAGVVWHTGNGGDTWYRQNIGGPKMATRVRFLDSDSGIVTGGRSFLLSTSSGGNAWRDRMLEMESLCAGCSTDVQGVSFASADSCWVVAGKPPEDDSEFTHGEGQAFRTTNGGSSWARVLRDTVWDFYDVACIDGRNICIVGGNDQTGQGIVLRTSDNGETWLQAVVLPSACYLRSLKFVGPDSGWACGDSGTIIKTTNSGLTWYRQFTPTCSTLYDIDFADSQRGMTSGAGVVLVTTDGGLPWFDRSPIPVAEPKPTCPPANIRLRALASPACPPICFMISGEGVPGELAIHSGAGRLVRILSVPCSRSPARHPVTWDGLDLNRLPAPSGVYFARLGSASSRVCLFVLLRRD